MAEPVLATSAPAALARTGAVVFGEAAKADFTAKFTTWMTGEQRRVYAICQRLLQDRDEADSATQDVFLKAYQALMREDARAVEDPARWVTRIAVNACLDRLRSRKWQFWRRRPVSDPEDLLLRAVSARPEAEDRYFARQIRERLDRAMDRLSTRQRAVFTLRHYQDLSLEEISVTLDLDVGTVKAHMFRAVSKLRDELRDLYGDLR